MLKGMKTKPKEVPSGRTLPFTRPVLAAFLSLTIISLAGGLSGSDADYVPESLTPASGAPSRVGLAYGGDLPAFDLQIPDTKSEAAGEMAAKLGLKWMRDLHEGLVCNELDGLGVYVGMAFTPVGMTAGAIYGAGAGESARKLQPALMVVTNAMNELQVQEGIQRHLFLLVREKSLQPLTVLTNSFPAESAFRVPSLMDAYAPLPFSLAPRQPEIECASSGNDAVDTLLLIRVVNHGLSGRHGYNSTVALNVALRVTLVRVADRAQLSGFYAQYDGPSRHFIDWAAHDAQPFREEWQRALQSLADQIVAQAGLLSPQPGPIPTGIVQAATR